MVEHSLEWYKQIHDRRKEKIIEWKKKNKKKLGKYGRTRYNKNREKFKERSRIYRKKNPEKVKIMMKNWKLKHPDYDTVKERKLRELKKQNEIKSTNQDTIKREVELNGTNITEVTSSKSGDFGTEITSGATGSREDRNAKADGSEQLDGREDIQTLSTSSNQRNINEHKQSNGKNFRALINRFRSSRNK